MKFESTSLPGVLIIEPELKEDERGFLLRTYCESEFAARNLNTHWPQCNLTLTRKRGMIRGMHYQAEPKPEIKLICCVAGAVWDVLVDIRPDSPTFSKWEAFELSAANCRQLYVPGGYAHGFQCLTSDCQLFYQMSETYVPELARGVRWDDPKMSIPWPIPDFSLSGRDLNLPSLSKRRRET
jgi:dTDP-4-dehydrorhamnose 3,5-epimerase